MGNPKEKESEGAMGDLTSPWDVHQTNRDLSQERDQRDAALVKTIAEAVATKMAIAHAKYTA